MNKKQLTRIFVPLAVTALVAGLSSAPVGAGNDLGFRWGDPAVTPFHPDLKLVDQSVDAPWSGVVDAVEADWDDSSDVLTLESTPSTSTTEISGSLCSTDWDPNVEIGSGVLAASEIHFCNDDFGNTGWVGLAINWVTGGGEIVVSQTLMNDFFLQDASSVYDDDNARRHVACQEIGHGFGLDHQRGRNKQTCMNDRFGLLSSSFISPNQHDFDQLGEIYDGAGGNGGGGGGGGGNCPPNSNAPQCQSGQRDFGTLTPVVHVIPAPVPGS